MVVLHLPSRCDRVSQISIWPYSFDRFDLVGNKRTVSLKELPQAFLRPQRIICLPRKEKLRTVEKSSKKIQRRPCLPFNVEVFSLWKALLLHQAAEFTFKDKQFLCLLSIFEERALSNIGKMATTYWPPWNIPLQGNINIVFGLRKRCNTFTI